MAISRLPWRVGLFDQAKSMAPARGDGGEAVAAGDRDGRGAAARRPVAKLAVAVIAPAPSVALSLKRPSR